MYKFFFWGFWTGIYNNKPSWLKNSISCFPLWFRSPRLFINTFLISVFSNNCIPVSNNHQVCNQFLQHLRLSTQFLIHNINFLIVVWRGRHIYLYYHITTTFIWRPFSLTTIMLSLCLSTLVTLLVTVVPLFVIVSSISNATPHWLPCPPEFATRISHFRFLQ